MSYTRLVVITLVIIVAALGLSGCAGASAATLAPQAGAVVATAATLDHNASACSTASPNAVSATGDAPLSACTLRSTAGAGLAGLPVAAGAAKVDVDGAGSYTNVSAADLAAMLKAKDFKLINVHTPYAGEIEGTDLWLPYDQVEQRLGELPADKTSRILLYCRSGMMSGIAARALVKLGYTNVWNLEGGMGAWEQAGYSVVTKK